MPAVKTPLLASPHPQQRQNDRNSASPNYFAFHANDSSNPFLTGSSAQHAKQNWSPPSSTVRSAAAMSPTMIPNDQRPEYDAFRRQSEGKAFNLGDLGGFRSNTSPAVSRSQLAAGRAPSTKNVPQVTTTHAADSPKMPSPPNRHRAESMTNTELHVAHSPKRVLSPGSSSLQGPARRQTPATDEPISRAIKGTLPPIGIRSKVPSGPILPQLRTEASAPSDSESNRSMFISSQQFASILSSSPESVLLLDLRVATMYAASHISTALNLCIPTTLLKRPSFNIRKLADTFKSDDQKANFERWHDCEYIIVYDSSSSQPKDAAICVNTIKKFQVEGYTGTMHIIKGGFLDFSRRYPAHIDTHGAMSLNSLGRDSIDDNGPEVAPVAGGCPMPATTNAANPFFGNIRQNMDLIGGVGMMALQRPKRATKELESHAFPQWLRTVAEENDAGQRVSQKFENIERREKRRMEDALSCKAAWASPSSETEVRIAGLEKGSKNRYNNIYPFEHSRVKLQGVSPNGCDYVNASYIKATWSHKRFISTQAPIPATFNDFWSMMWQQDIRVIVMLTAEKEGAQVKADNYWNKKRYGPFHLEFLSEKRASLDAEKIRRHRHRPSGHRHSSSSLTTSSSSNIIAEIRDEKPDDQPFVIVRKFTVSHEGQPFERMREITQLQYANWPDFGAPADPAHLVSLVRQCDSVVRSIEHTSNHEPAKPGQRPVLVHCSAGCGRTGTFCTVDSVIDMLKRRADTRQKARSSSPMDIDGKETRSSRSPDAMSFFESRGVRGGIEPNGEWERHDDLDLVEKTVEDFRFQRISMVQSLRQYVLCYESVMEWLIQQELDDSPT